MALQPVSRRSVPEEVFEQILDEVFSGQMQPGESLPSERRLAEVLGVSRPAVREALKRVAAAGLVEVRQGDATTVRDFRRHAGLDLLRNRLPGYGSYRMDKAALLAAARGLPVELAPQGVRVNSVAPGYIWGEKIRAFFERQEASGGKTVAESYAEIALDTDSRRLPAPDEIADVAVARSILEARLHNGPKVAELAARRRSPGLTDLLEQSIRDLETDADPVGQQRHALTFWDHVVDGADSIVFRLMFNTLRAAYEPALPALATMMAAEAGHSAAYRPIARAIAGGDPVAAEEAARQLLEPATHALIAALNVLEDLGKQEEQ